MLLSTTRPRTRLRPTRSLSRPPARALISVRSRSPDQHPIILQRLFNPARQAVTQLKPWLDSRHHPNHCSSIKLLQRTVIGFNILRTVLNQSNWQCAPRVQHTRNRNDFTKIGKCNQSSCEHQMSIGAETGDAPPIIRLEVERGDGGEGRTSPPNFEHESAPLKLWDC